MRGNMWPRVWIFLILVACGGFSPSECQRYNPSTDFLQHEAGRNSGPKRDFVASQFPPLSPAQEKPANEQLNGQTHTTSTTKPKSYASVLFNSQPTVATPSTGQPNGKRDYVAPPKPTSNTITTKLTTQGQSKATTPITPSTHSSGKRDYVNPNIHTITTKLPTQGQSKATTSVTPSTQSSGKRDYVNPNIQSGGKVKDLINFYDDKGKIPQNQHGYSSTISGNKATTVSPFKSTHGIHMNPAKVTSPNSPTPATKPSYGSVVSGSNQSGTQKTSLWTTITTAKPSIGGSFKPASHNTDIKNHRTTKPPLPSSFINNNKKDQGGSATDSEIQELSEELLRKDSNNAAKFLTINYQEKTTSHSQEDKAPLPLLVVANDAWNIPTIQKFVPLLDNYERDTLVNEYVTPQERNEENAFMDAIMSTSVIRHLMTFLKNKGIVSPDPKQQRDFLKQLWFSLYSRGKGKISSSGFEHIFVSELKNGEVSGLHNWIYFSKEEAANRVNYLGYLKYSQFSDKGAVLKLHFNQQGTDKPVDTMFIGTSPELEIALYTLCFVTRADKDCSLKLGGKDVNIITHTFRYRSKNLIGSAYPQI